MVGLVINMETQKHKITTKKLTFIGLPVAEVTEWRGVNACIVCETPAAKINSSLSCALVRPRALNWLIFN